MVHRPHLESINNDSEKPDWEKWRVWCVVGEGMRLKVMACGGVELKAGGGGEGEVEGGCEGEKTEGRGSKRKGGSGWGEKGRALGEKRGGVLRGDERVKAGEDEGARGGWQ